MTRRAGRNATWVHKPLRRLKPSREIQQVGKFDQFQAALPEFAAAVTGIGEIIQQLAFSMLAVGAAIDQDRAALRERWLAEEFRDG